MFSALKKLTGRGDAPDPAPLRPGHQTMSANLQRKFAKGVQYNMKIVIKGDRNVGKTCLFHRLQGKQFIESYIPTEEIQVTSIHWNYKATDDIVKVEVWDVVDKGKKKKTFEGLKLENSQLEIPEEAALDAEFLDVYKNANGVILVMDITKSWTFDYIQKELPKIPNHIPVMILANHCDMTHHRTVTSHHLNFYVENLERGKDAAQVRCCESSMRNGFGLKILHKFFNLPFLQLQKDTLQKQLETNRIETELTTNELDLYMESEDADYNKFVEKLAHKRRLVADSARPAVLQSSQSVHQLQQPDPKFASIPSSQSVSDIKRSVSFNETYRIGPIGGGHPISSGLHKTAIGVGNPHSKVLGPNFNLSDVISRSPGESRLEPVTDACVRNAVPEPIPGKDGAGGGGGGGGTFMSKLFGKSKGQSLESTYVKSNIQVDNSITTLDEFVPDDGTIDRSFLEDTGQDSAFNNVEPESESDTEFGNPLVSGFQDDLDPDDIPVNSTVTSRNSRNIVNNVNEISAKVSMINMSSNTKQVESQNGERRDSATSDEIAFDTQETFTKWTGEYKYKWRRSPEGGEDSHNDCTKVKDDSVSLNSVTLSSSLLDTSGSKKEKKKKKEKEGEDKSKKLRKKSSSEKQKEKIKDKSNGEKKKKRISKSEEELKQRDELEEFLNGPSAGVIDASYEAF